MSEQRYIVPDGMLKAAKHAIRIVEDYNPLHASSPTVVKHAAVSVAAALRWLSENPMVPTEKQERELDDAWTESKRNLVAPYHQCAHATAFGAIEWQRRCFLAQEPEVCLVEKTLRNNKVTISNDWLCPECDKVHEAILFSEPEVPNEIAGLLKHYEGENCYLTVKIAMIEAYRRGQSSPKKSAELC